jgi:hypothetical protein
MDDRKAKDAKLDIHPNLGGIQIMVGWVSFGTI